MRECGAFHEHWMMFFFFADSLPAVNQININNCPYLIRVCRISTNMYNRTWMGFTFSRKKKKSRNICHSYHNVQCITHIIIHHLIFFQVQQVQLLINFRLRFPVLFSAENILFFNFSKAKHSKCSKHEITKKKLNN